MIKKVKKIWYERVTWSWDGKCKRFLPCNNRWKGAKNNSKPLAFVEKGLLSTLEVIP